MAKVSVIVPVYGVEEYIEKCMSSIVNQTFKDIEIIVVNDGTKDNSINIIKEKFKDKRIKIYNKENGGLADARNYGIPKASGEYLFFVDSDDYLDTNAIYEMYEKIVKDNTDIVICDYYKTFENGVKEHMKMIPHYNKDDAKSAVTSMPSAWGKLIKTSIVKKNNIEFLKDHYFEDNAIMPFACALCKNFSYIEKPFYYYLQRTGSILNQDKYNKKWEDIFDAIDSLYKRFKTENKIKDYHDELEYIYIEYLLHAPSLKFLKYQEGIPNIKKIGTIMKEKFPNWRKNKYYKLENIKYKIICNVFYYNQIWLAKILLRK